MGGRTVLGRVVIDTNVWISAWMSREGVPATWVRHAIQCGEPVFSRATFDELSERLLRPKFDRYIGIELRHSLLHDLGAIAYWAEVSGELEARLYCRDPDDDKLIHAALAAGAGLLVTGDTDLLVLGVVESTRILTPRAALDQLSRPG